VSTRSAGGASEDMICGGEAGWCGQVVCRWGVLARSGERKERVAAAFWGGKKEKRVP
jgi:hypothetical protein